MRPVGCQHPDHTHALAHAPCLPRLPRCVKRRLRSPAVKKHRWVLSATAAGAKTYRQQLPCRLPLDAAKTNKPSIWQHFQGHQLEDAAIVDHTARQAALSSDVDTAAGVIVNRGPSCFLYRYFRSKRPAVCNEPKPQSQWCACLLTF